MEPESIISTILKHDKKVNTYKFALLRAINDVALSFPDLRSFDRDVAVPLKLLAQFWVAYYWPFVKPNQPIWQGQRAILGDELRNDMAFRPELTELRRVWEGIIGGDSRPSDGFFLINELRVLRRHQSYKEELHKAFSQSLTAIAKTIEMPVRYAGPGNWTVFDKPIKYSDIDSSVKPIPGTQPTDKCLIISSQLWVTFQKMFLWIEALCIHEWSMFSERVEQENQQKMYRGFIYQLLTDRPDNRRPLTWERNNVDLLLMEDREFICPWTEKRITNGTKYDLDHLLPLSLYPINELWNLVPADPDFNSHKKRDRLPQPEKLQQAKPHLELAYSQYGTSQSLATALKSDVASRFSTLSGDVFPTALANAVVNLIDIVGESRNIARF